MGACQIFRKKQYVTLEFPLSKAAPAAESFSAIFAAELVASIDLSSVSYFPVSVRCTLTRTATLLTNSTRRSE